MTTTEKAPLRIIGLMAENFKRLVAVEIKPTGNVVEIVGPNEAGKSSIMDAISAALGGDDAVPEMPIRKGETEATIRVDLGEMVIIKTFKMREDGKSFITRFRVENADGFKATSPQTLLDGLLGRFSFDPMEFDRLKMPEKFEVMKSFVPGIDFAALAKSDEKDRKDRTDINRDIKALAAQITAIAIPKDAPTEKVDEAALVEEIGQVGTFNGEIEARKARREQAAAEIQTKRKEADDAMTRVKALRAEADKLEAAAMAADAAADALCTKLREAPPLDAPKDVAEVRARLDAAKAVNAIVDRRVSRAALQAKHDSLKAKSDALSTAITKRQVDKIEAIANAKLPVEGLEFGDGVILLNGIPLDQCSAAQRLRTSVAIAMAVNPRLKVLRINEGSLLDRRGMQIIAEMCEGRGYQAWVEKVDDDAKSGFIIEEGRLRGAASPAGGDQARAA